MHAALKAFETWRHTALEDRAQFLFRVSKMLRERKHEISAWMIFEVSKNWAEADADTAELIDFAEFYAYEASAAGEGRASGADCRASMTCCDTFHSAWAL